MMLAISLSTTSLQWQLEIGKITAKDLPWDIVDLASVKAKKIKPAAL